MLSDDLLFRANRLHKKLDKIKEEIDQLYVDEKSMKPVCNLCGSELRASQYAHYCKQEYGPCGELLMSNKAARGEKWSTFFRRTRYHRETLKHEPFYPTWIPLFHTCFISGVEVTIKEYLLKGAEENDG